jgi:hypothetical protein
VQGDCLGDEDDGECVPSNNGSLNFTTAKNANDYDPRKLVTSNPGANFLNVVHVGDKAATLELTVRYPFITVGKNVTGNFYDFDERIVIEDIPFVGFDCFRGRDDAFGVELGDDDSDVQPFHSFDLKIRLADYFKETDDANRHNLKCTLVKDPPNADGFCTFDVEIPATPENEQEDGRPVGSSAVYFNLHLRHGLLGAKLDVNPDDGLADRYDRGAAGGIGDIDVDGFGHDALVHAPETEFDGVLGIATCQEYVFERDGSVIRMSTINVFEQTNTDVEVEDKFCVGGDDDGEVCVDDNDCKRGVCDD